MAAGLVAMAAGASRGEWAEARGAARAGQHPARAVAPLAQRNVAAYAEAVARLRGGGDGGAEGEDLGVLLERAARIPLEIAEAAVDVASLAAVVAERGEQALRADAVGRSAAGPRGARAAATLVEVNLATTSSDERVTRARDLAGTAAAAANRALATLA